MMIGYARVSTEDQNADLQRDALTAAGCTEIFEDNASGATMRREGLKAAIDRCPSGGVLVVWKLDRLGRSLLDLVSLAEDLKHRDIGLRVLTGSGASINTTTPEGRMLFGILASLAEFERELIRERTKAGMAAARRRGVKVGRPHKLTRFQLREAKAMVEAGRSQIDVAVLMGVHVATLRRALQGRA